ncbi:MULTISPECIES: hypothetical protein [unclassified Cupriavidus]|uniref:hypothetical protein n=1 Tax=unclassified Cupriavidus TaxID=2640874 RepID=UPI000E8805D9|nr:MULTISPECIES: hypothetical protein [unclassified Cupriavidus]HBD33151.1 hypothetical protein [Cupriavidus sp.]HBO83082.1 hypothetical protein [Cupriavidus sp.]
MAEKLDLDALERIADEERWRGNRTDGNHFNVRVDYHNATRPSTIYALIARIRALESASQPGSGEAWQPIETAPKDGTEILLCRDERVTSGAWGEWEETTSEYHSTTGEYLGKSVQDCGASWWSWDGGFTQEAPPTHWMPMPAAPSAGNGEAKGDGNV